MLSHLAISRKIDELIFIMTFRTIFRAFNSMPMRLLLTQLVVAFTALIVNVFSARTLGPEARGELALFMQIAYVANAISILGRHRSYLRLETDASIDLASSHKNINVLSTAPFVLSTITSFVIAAIVGDGVLAALALAIGLFTLVYSGVQQKTFRSAAIVAKSTLPYFFATLAGQLMLLVGVAILAFYDVSDISIWLIVYGLCVMVPYSLMNLRLTCRSEAVPSDQAQLQHVKKLGIRLVPLSAAEIIGARADRFLLPLLANFAQLGIYTVVVTMTEFIAWPVRNYTDSRVPQWGREIAHRKFKLFRELFFVTSGVLVLSMALGIILHLGLIPLFGKDFSAGRELVWPLVLAAALHAWAIFGTNLNLAAGHTALVNISPISGMVVSGLSYFAFIPAMGAIGAAWGLAVGHLVSVLVSARGIIGVAKRVRG